MAIFKNEKKLDNEELKDVNGGYIYDTGKLWIGNGNIYLSLEVIDDKTGDVIQEAKSYGEACSICKERGLSTKEIDADLLNALRKGAVVHGSKTPIN